MEFKIDKQTAITLMRAVNFYAAGCLDHKSGNVRLSACNMKVLGADTESLFGIIGFSESVLETFERHERALIGQSMPEDTKTIRVIVEKAFNNEQKKEQ